MKEVRDFACQCGDDNKQKLVDLREWYRTEFKVSNPHWETTQMLFDILVSYTANIEWLAMDQWGGMTITTAESDDFVIPEGAKLRIQWDVFEDGLALAIKYLHDIYGPGGRRYKGDE